jgi:hypothetical protein
MMLIQKLLFISIALICCLSDAEAASISQDFRGLKWGSSEGEVQSKFPEVENSSKTCEVPLAKEYAVNMGIKCYSYVIRNYQIGEYKFFLSFNFDLNNNGLTRITVSASNELESEMVAGNRDVESVYIFLKDNLISEYGKPNNVKSNHEGKANEILFNEASLWLNPDLGIGLSGYSSKRDGKPRDVYIYLTYRSPASELLH